MTKVVPAILEHDIGEYRRKLRIVRQLTNRVQLDIIDGEIIDNRTVQLQDLDPPSGLKVDIHLMVKNPKEHITFGIRLRPYTIIVQYEGAEDVVGAIDKVKTNGIRAGVAINPDTDLDEIDSLLNNVDYVLLMAYPAGFAGQKMQPAVLDRVRLLRDRNFTGEIGLDGGVASETLPEIAEAKFDIVNTNSYLFETDRILTRYHEIMEALN